MALVVEDNTGLSTAESYVDVATFKAYCTARNIDPTNLGDGTDPFLEGELRKGFTYVNTNWQYKSFPISNDQAGEFPRSALSDGMGRIFNVVPKRVKDAQCEATIASASGIDLFTIADRGGMIASEAVGPISTTYQAGAPAETLFQAVRQLVGCFCRNPDEPRRSLPDYNDYGGDGVDTGPVFSVGMDDNTDTKPPLTGGV